MSIIDDNISGTSLGRVVDEWAKDAKIDRTQPDDEMAKVPQLHAKYLRFLAQSRKNSRKAESDYQKMRGLRTMYYDGSMDKPTLDLYGWTPYLGLVKTRSGIDRLLETDEILLGILEAKFDSEQIVDLCEKILKELNNRTWELRSYMDWQKFIRPNG